jgi:hypothetical protein
MRKVHTEEDEEEYQAKSDESQLTDGAVSPVGPCGVKLEQGDRRWNVHLQKWICMASQTEDDHRIHEAGISPC